MAEQAQVLLRLDTELLERIDVARGDVSRVAWFRSLAERAVEDPDAMPKELTGGCMDDAWLAKVDAARGTIGLRSYVWGAVLGWIDVTKPRQKPDKAKASALRVGLEPWERPFSYEKPAHADTCGCKACKPPKVSA